MLPRFECTIPILRVISLQDSLKYYQDVLGFERDWGGDGEYSYIASVSRDQCPLMLFEGAQGQLGTWVWIGVEDIEPLYQDFLARGVKFIMPPTNFWWALEMRIEDPNGHVLRFGSESRPELPLCDPLMDYQPQQ